MLSTLILLISFQHFPFQLQMLLFITHWVCLVLPVCIWAITVTSQKLPPWRNLTIPSNHLSKIDPQIGMGLSYSCLDFGWLDFMCAVTTVVNSCSTILSKNTVSLYIDPWFSQETEYDTVILLRTEHSTIPCSLHVDLLWVSALVFIHNKKKLCDESWVTYYIYRYKSKNMESSLLLCHFTRITVLSSPLGQ